APGPVAGLPNIEFEALYFGPIPDSESDSPVYTKFKLTEGADLDSRILLPVMRPRGPDRFHRLVIDPATKKGYALGSGLLKGVVEVDLASKATRLLPAIPQDPRIGAVSSQGIAFDTRRERVLVSTNRNLFAYTLKTGKWE